MGSFVPNGEIPPPHEILIAATSARSSNSVFEDKQLTVIIQPYLKQGDIKFSIDPTEDDLNEYIFKNMDHTKVLAPYEIKVVSVKNPFPVSPWVEICNFLSKGKVKAYSFRCNDSAVGVSGGSVDNKGKEKDNEISIGDKKEVKKEENEDRIQQINLGGFAIIANTNGCTEIPLQKSRHSLDNLKTYAGLTEVKLADMVTVPKNAKEGYYYANKSSLFYLFICKNSISLTKHIKGEDFTPDDGISSLSYLHHCFIKEYAPSKVDFQNSKKKASKEASAIDRSKKKTTVNKDNTEFFSNMHSNSKSKTATTFTKLPITNKDREMLQISAVLGKAAHNAMNNLIKSIEYINRSSYKMNFTLKPSERQSFQEYLADESRETSSKIISITFRLMYVRTEMPEDGLPFNNSPLNP